MALRTLPALPPAVGTALSRFREVLATLFGPRLREVVLFGSYARGAAHEESDVDVLVVVDGLTEGERREVMDAAYDAGAVGDEWVSISPLPYSAVQAADLRRRERRLLRDVDAEGVAL
jgi:predicted nucleotidyltransferase